jgi:hypothetical protein
MGFHTQERNRKLERKHSLPLSTSHNLASIPCFLLVQSALADIPFEDDSTLALPLMGLLSNRHVRRFVSAVIFNLFRRCPSTYSLETT